jgi:hypothetical protein
MDDIVSISDSKALKTDGSLWAWGYGSPGDGIARGWEHPALTPVKVMDSVATIIETGYNYSMVITTDGSLWAWGSNIGGQLGDGTASGHDHGSGDIVYYDEYIYDDDEYLYIDNDRHSPVLIIDSVAYASSFPYYFPGSTIVIRTDGSMWAWGSNDFGQLGDGTTERRYSPVKISDSTVWSDSVVDSDPDTTTEATAESPTQQEKPTEPSGESESGRNPGMPATPESRLTMPFLLILICISLCIITGVSLIVYIIKNRKPGN